MQLEFRTGALPGSGRSLTSQNEQEEASRLPATKRAGDWGGATR